MVGRLLRPEALPHGCTAHRHAGFSMLVCWLAVTEHLRHSGLQAGSDPAPHCSGLHPKRRQPYISCVACFMLTRWGQDLFSVIAMQHQRNPWKLCMFRLGHFLRCLPLKHPSLKSLKHSSSATLPLPPPPRFPIPHRVWRSE